MVALTRSNIAHDLNISPHKYDIHYPDGVVTYVFSSELYRRNFEERYKDNRATINQSLSKRFGFRITCDKVADLKTYISIEKRGFLLYKNGDKFDCLNDITLDGTHLMMRI